MLIIFSEEFFFTYPFSLYFILFLVKRWHTNGQGETIHLQSWIDKIYLQRGRILIMHRKKLLLWDIPNETSGLFHSRS